MFESATCLRFLFNRPLHLCIATWNVAVVKRWVELASSEEITSAIDIPSPVGTALCMAAALKKDREAGRAWIENYCYYLIGYYR